MVVIAFRVNSSPESSHSPLDVSEEPPRISDQALKTISMAVTLGAACYAFAQTPSVDADSLMLGVLAGMFITPKSLAWTREDSIHSLFVTAISTAYLALTPGIHTCVPFLAGFGASRAAHRLLTTALA